MTPGKRVKQWLDTGLSFIYPDVCQICRDERATVNEGFVCVSCWRRIRFIRPPFCERCGLPFGGEMTGPFECANCRELEYSFRSARSAVLTGDVMLEAIHRYKYQQALWFEPFLADLLVREAKPALAREHWDAIVPVPLHPAKRRERGFNQAEWLGACLSKATRIPLKTALLKRTHFTETQTRLTREQRAANVRGAFAPGTREKLAGGPRLVVVDDVLTTGATTSACAAVLKKMGASEVCVWTVARGS